MIRPPGFRGAAFTTATDGDLRGSDRSAASEALGIADRWAWVTQIHSDRLVVADQPGDLGEADAVLTDHTNLAVAVFTADCFGVVIEGEGATAVVHAGWRGVAAGIVRRAIDAFDRRGDSIERVAIGPGIQSCCFEVGPEVSTKFPEYQSTTSWGTASVDLAAALQAPFRVDEVWSSGACTRCESGFYSHRRDRTSARMATIAWIP